MDLKKAWNKATSPFKKAAKKVADHLVFITTKADDDVQRREICGFLGVASLTAAFFMVSGGIAGPALTKPVIHGPIQTQQQSIPAQNEGERVMEEVMGSVLGLAGAAHIGLAAKSHMNLKKKAGPG